MARLNVDFCGELRGLAEDQILTFGRAGDLVIDDANPYMHRLVGQFRHDGHVWWLDNLGTAIELVVHASSGSRTHLRPAAAGLSTSVALVEAAYDVRFTAGSAAYRIDAGLDLSGVRLGVAPPATGGFGSQTVGHGVIDLTLDERRMVAALARPLLLDPTATPASLPANAEVAALLGVRLTTYNRKLDRLCDRFRKAGVAGLQGTRGAEASNRRWALVTHAVARGLVGPSDLDAETGRP